jgi:hypothetical protein
MEFLFTRAYRLAPARYESLPRDLEDLAGHEPGIHRETLWLLDC